MSDYTQITSFAPKDSLTTGDPNKKILGSQIDAEFTAIAAAISSKRDNTAITESDIADGSILARVASNETISGSWTFSGTTTSVSSAFPVIQYLDTNLTETTGKRWYLGTGNDTFQVLRNTAVAGDFSTYDTVLTATTASFIWMGNTVWHSGNDGVGTGLDADLLDGQQGSYYTNATNIGTGTLADGRLSANVALLNTSGTFSGGPTFSGTVNFSGTLTYGSIEVGFRGIPQNSQSANYTCVIGDAGKQIFHPSGGGASDVFTIPANASVAYAVGTVLTFINRDSNAVSIAITSDTMYLAGTTTTGTRTLGQNGIATATKVESTVWIISGSGLT